MRFAFLTLWFCVVCFSFYRSLQIASERHGFLPTSPCSSRAPELGASPAVFLFWCMLAFILVFISIADRLGLLLSDRRGITQPLLWKSAALVRSPTEILRLKRSR